MTEEGERKTGARSPRRALVTGGAGFLGSHLVRRLRSDGWETVVIARRSSDLRRLAGELDSVRLVHADLLELDPANLACEFDSIDVLFHLAAVGLHEPAPRPPDEVMRINVIGTLNILRLAAEAGVGRVVHCGTGLEYGIGTLLREDAPLRPASIYAGSKAAAWLLAETFCRGHSVELVGLRPFTVYGPSDSPWGFVGSLVIAAIDGVEFELTEGRQRRDFVFVDDVVEALIVAATLPALDGEVFNVCTGRETSIRDAARLVVELSGGHADPVFGARPYRDHELWASSGDPTKASERLKWVATTGLREGLGKTIAYEKTLRQDGALEEIAAK